MARKRTNRSSMTKSRSEKMDSQTVKMDSQPVRARMLGEVQEIVSAARNLEYGEPGQNMARTAQMLAAYIGSRPGEALAAHDVAAFGIILKLGRLAENPGSMDSWRDVAGYASIGFEIMEAQQPKKRGRPPKK